MQVPLDIDQMAGLSLQNTATYSQLGNDYIFSTLNAADLPAIKGLEAPVRFDGITLAIIRRGGVRFELNLVDCEASSGQLVFFPPQTIIKVQGINDEGLEADMLFVSAPFLKNLNIDMRVFKPRPELRTMQPIFTLEGVTGEIVERYFQLLHLHASVGQSDDELDRAISRSLIAALIYQLYSMALQRVNEAETQQSTTARRWRGRQVNYVMEFISLVQKHFHAHRSIAFYASRLFISPKYLSEVVKAQTGHSPSAIIEQYVLTEAKSLLLYSGKSIQQIGYELSFVSQSSFGKFFKNHTGMSPRQYQKS